MQVCKLQKALHGLKQAPRVWHQKLTTVLFSLGFSMSIVDLDLCFAEHNNHRVYLLIHEYLIASSHLVGEMAFFLRLQITRDESGISVSQQ